MAFDRRHIGVSAIGFAVGLLLHGSASAGGGIYVGPNGQKVTGEVVGNQMILISGNGARTPAPPGVYSCATGQHCPGGQQIRVQGGGLGVVVLGGSQPASPRDPAVKMGVQGNAPAGQLAPPPPGSAAYKERAAGKSEIRESAIKGQSVIGEEGIKGQAYKERSGIKGESAIKGEAGAYKERAAIKGEIKGETQIGGGQGISGEKPRVGGSVGTMPELKSPATQGSR